MQAAKARWSSSDTGRSRAALPLSVSWSSSRPPVAATLHASVSATSCGPVTFDRSQAAEQPAANTKRNRTAIRVFMRPPVDSVERSPAGDDHVDEAIAVEVEAPARRVCPHLLRMPSDGFPETTGRVPHRGLVRRHRVGLLQQEHHLVLLHPDHNASLEPQPAGPRGSRDLRPPRQIRQDPGLEPFLPCDLLVERRQPAVALHEPRHPYIVCTRALGCPLHSAAAGAARDCARGKEQKERQPAASGTDRTHNGDHHEASSWRSSLTSGDRASASSRVTLRSLTRPASEEFMVRIPTC